ncbi:ASCH domain-containing protein [Eggerthia catenaformis]
MCSILLSINPEYVEKIMNGSKKFEYRKRECKRKIDRIVIYSTAPVKKIIGEAEVEKVLVDSLEKIWKITKDFSGIDKIFFDSYYRDKDYAVVYQLKNIIEYASPRDLSEYGISNAPQSFQYIQE